MFQFLEPNDFDIQSPSELPNVNQPQPTPFAPIGIGRPLVIRLHTVYVGDLSEFIRGRRFGLLVTSRMKDDITFAKPAPAIHQIYDELNDRKILTPSASTEGTELIYYSKALDRRRLFIDLELKTQKMRESFVARLSNSLSLSGQIPLFMPISPLIVVGNQLLNLGSDTVDDAMDNIPVLRSEMNITNEIGGLIDEREGFKIGANLHQLDQFRGYEIKSHPQRPNCMVLMKDGKLYDGDSPYLIISYDGRADRNYEGFNAAMASAAAVKRMKETEGGSPLEDIHQLMEIYNDFQYTRRIKETRQDLEAVSDPQKKQHLEQLLSAYQKNIVHSEVFGS